MVENEGFAAVKKVSGTDVHYLLVSQDMLSGTDVGTFIE